MKLLTIIGARPQFIKAAALSRVIKKYPDLNEVILHTGQHHDKNMSSVFFNEMDIPEPHYNLNINGGGHGVMTGQMLEGIEKIILQEKPDAVLVFGDTNSTLAGALAAKKLHVKLAHVEAGLRSFNMNMPEEINRIVTDRISDWLFCPTDTAIDNLNKEGFANFTCNIVKSGDVMEDAAIFYASKAEQNSTIIHDYGLSSDEFILGTIHRAENTDNVNNLKKLVAAFDEVNRIKQVIIPLHPRTKNILKENNINPSFRIIDPIGYFDMITLLKNCAMVITDSGGLQKEAFFFKKFCITVREQTEWTELVHNGYNVLAGTDKELIINLTKELLTKPFPKIADLYGNGMASDNICKALLM